MSLNKFLPLLWIVTFFTAAGCDGEVKHSALVSIAPEVVQCEVTWPAMKEHLDASWDIVDLDDAQGQVLVASINRSPPITDYAAEQVHIAEKDGVAYVLVYLVTEGCVSNEIQVPGAMLSSLMSGHAQKPPPPEKEL